MPISEDMSDFFHENTGTYFSTNDRSMLLEFANFVQARLNTALALITNEQLMLELGLNPKDVLEEIRTLLGIARKIRIPQSEKSQEQTFNKH